MFVSSKEVGVQAPPRDRRVDQIVVYSEKAVPGAGESLYADVTDCI
jgi:hypothetical protein